MPQRALSLACATLLLIPLPLALAAQDSAASGAEAPPLSVIDWLGAQRPPAAPKDEPGEEPAVATSALPPQVTVRPLGESAPRLTGLVPGDVTGLPEDLWAGSEAEVLRSLITEMPDLTLPAAQSLLYTLLLAEAAPPRGDPAAGESLALARVSDLMRRGAIDPALALVEQVGVTRSPDHFDLWMELSLLAGTEDRACAILRAAPHLTRDYGFRIFCAAREQAWEDAALTFGSAQALGLLPDWKLDLIDRFLNPDLFEEAEPMRVPRGIDPLSFRMFEAIGEPLPSGSLPRPFANADLRDLAGWKAQLEAAERLARAGALPDNRLLGLYTERAPAASGGVWDRVAALRDFDTALASGSAEAVTKTLPRVWEAMQEAELEMTFVGLFAEPLTELELSGRAGTVAETVGLLSTQYESAASGRPAEDLIGGLARGEVTGRTPEDPLPAAIHAAFTEAPPRADLVSAVQEQRLGETILRLVEMLQEGTEGDLPALRDALATLRAIGLEDVARRAALQLMLLER